MAASLISINVTDDDKHFTLRCKNKMGTPFFVAAPFSAYLTRPEGQKLLTQDNTWVINENINQRPVE